MIDVRALPKANGKLYEVPEPDLARREDSWMVKIDAKVGEEITLRKGTLWAIGITPVLLMLVFNYGGAMIGWTRDDQQLRTQVDIMAKSIDALNNKVDKLAETIQAQQIQSAKIDGFKAGVAESQSDKNKEK